MKNVDDVADNVRGSDNEKNEKKVSGGVKMVTLSNKRKS